MPLRCPRNKRLLLDRPATTQGRFVKICTLPISHWPGRDATLDCGEPSPLSAAAKYSSRQTPHIKDFEVFCPTATGVVSVISSRGARHRAECPGHRGAGILPAAILQHGIISNSAKTRSMSGVLSLPTLARPHPARHWLALTTRSHDLASPANRLSSLLDAEAPPSESAISQPPGHHAGTVCQDLH